VVTPHCSSQSVKRSRSSVKVANTRTGFSSRPGGTATNISRAPTSMAAAFGSNTGRSSKHFPLLCLPVWVSLSAIADYRLGSCSLVARFLSCKQRPSCAIQGTLPNGISWVTPLLTTALRTELGATLDIGVRTTHHWTLGLLPLPVAPSQDAEMIQPRQVPFPLCPDHRAGLMLDRKARLHKCGGVTEDPHHSAHSAELAVFFPSRLI
jgi:hypothetical protein